MAIGSTSILPTLSFGAKPVNIMHSYRDRWIAFTSDGQNKIIARILDSDIKLGSMCDNANKVLNDWFKTSHLPTPHGERTIVDTLNFAMERSVDDLLDNGGKIVLKTMG